MSSENYIGLIECEKVAVGKVFGTPTGSESDSSKCLECVFTIDYNCIELNEEFKEEDEASLKKKLWISIDLGKSHFIERYEHGHRWGDMTIARDVLLVRARTHSGHNEFYLTLTENFMQLLCELFPHPMLHFKGKFEVRALKDENSPPWISAGFEKSFSVEDLFVAAQRKEDHSQILDRSIPSNLLEPAGTRSLKLTLEVSLGWSQDFVVPPPQLDGNDIVGKLFENDTTKDFTFVVGNGAEVKCHSVILAAHSPALTAMITSKMKESQTRRVEIRDVSEEGMNYLLRYLYGLQVSISDLGCDMALELFQTAHKYGLSQLEKALIEVFMRKRTDWFSPDMLLEMYFFVKNLKEFEKLREQSLQIMTRIPDEVRACNRYLELESGDALELVWKLFHVIK